MNLSVIIPVFNEEKNLEILCQELINVLDKLETELEIIFIDDGSTDKSFNILSDLQKNDDRIEVVRLRKNFGQTAALSAGFDRARGDFIVTLDADLQNDPEDIPKLLDKLKDGYDLVNGWRFDRKDHFLSRRLPSVVANKIISISTSVKLHDYGCTLKAFKKELIKNIRLYGEMHRFIPAIASGIGASITELKVNHRERRFGKSKYGIFRTTRVILDLITVKFLLSYASRPIQIFGLLGFFCEITGFGILLYLIAQRQLFDMPLANRPLLLFSILLVFMGLQFITLGLLGELQARTYHETQNKPIYVIKKILKNEDRDDDPITGN
ncbi:MAG: glycosyltransferase family 2 protein [Desulfobacterales bacterium]|mgnify:CR=1 FL=1|nr:glycosyltransferase family 2 protein [Desulfobacterales bacterium]MDP6806653.1 glycosyltransferase family 2 protein [Desulfobacterales bacterium]